MSKEEMSERAAKEGWTDPLDDHRKKAAAETAAHTESDSGSIAKKPLVKLVEAVKDINLVEVLQNDIGDPLTQYQDEDGNINLHKVPQVIYIVAISFKIIEIAKEIDLGMCVKHGVIYLYNGRFWEEVSDESMKKALSEIAVKMGLPYVAVARSAPFRVKLFDQFLSDGIAEAVTPKRDNILINLSNGTLEISKDNIALREHNREDFLMYSLPYNYDPNAGCPIFNSFLDKVLPDTNSRMILQEFVGFVFTSGLKIEKVLVLYGSGANGKSVFFEVISELMGRENISHKGLGDLCMKGDKGNNHRAEVENKLINYSSEISAKGADIDLFKGLTSGEPVPARRLYKDVYMFRNSAKLIFNANKLPTDTEKTHAFFRRYIIIPFEVTISDKERDVDLHNKIIDNELSGVMNWVVVGLKRLLKNSHFTKSEKVDAALEDFKRESNSVLQFIDEYAIVKNDYEFVSNKDLYSTYTEFCNSSGYNRFNQNNFSKEMVSAGFESVRKKVANKTKRGFKAEFEG